MIPETGNPTDLVVNRWVVDHLIDFMESTLPRNLGDLRLHGVGLLHCLKRSSNWLALPAGEGPQTSLELIGGRMGAPALRLILRQPNQRLHRSREMVPLESLKAQDARCLMWLARRPGIELNEKLAKDRRLLGVVRKTSFDVTENQVARQTAFLIERLLTPFDGKSGVPESQQIQRIAQRFLEFANANQIAVLANTPRANNALLRDRKYRRVWLSYRWLLSRDDFRATIAKHLERAILEAVFLLIASALNASGWELADAAVACVTRPEGEACWLKNQRIRGFWVVPGRLRLVDIHLGVKGEETVVDIRLRDTTGNPAVRGNDQTTESLVEIRSNGNNIELIGDQGRSTFHIVQPDGDFRLLYGWLRKQLPAIHFGYSSRSEDPQAEELDTVRFNASGLVWGKRTVDIFSGAFPTDDGSNSEKVALAGRGIRNRYVLGTSTRRIPGELTPGRMTRSLCQPMAGVGNLQGLFKYAGNSRDCTNLATAVPAGLPFGFESRLIQAFGPSAGDRWFIPQAMAALLQAKWGVRRIDPTPEELFVSIELGGECADLSFARWTHVSGPKGQRDFGWLHYREVREAVEHGPRWIHFLYSLVNRSLSNLPLEIRDLRNYTRQGLYQLSLDGVIDVLLLKEDHLEFWVATDSSSPQLCSIGGDFIEGILEQWVKESLLPWMDSRLAWFEKHYAQLDSCVLSGGLANIPVVQKAIDGWAISRNLNRPVNLGENAIDQGLRIFLERHAANEITWSEHLPVLELLARNSCGTPEWQRLFDEETSSSPGGKVLKGPTFTYQSDRRVLAVPMRCDGVRGTSDPLISIPDACSLPLTLNVEAQYDVGRAGLVMKVRSQQPGLLPEMEMSWGQGTSLPQVPQELSIPDQPLVPGNIKVLNEELRQAMLQFFESNGGEDQLRKAIESVGRQLSRYLVGSDSDLWRGIDKQIIIELTGRLCWMLDVEIRDLSSCVVENAKKRKTEFSSGNARKSREKCQKSARVQVALVSALGKLRAAAPFEFIKWLIKVGVHNQQPELCKESIRCLGRVLTVDNADSSKLVVDALVKGIANAVDGEGPADLRSLWYWSLHAALSSSTRVIEVFGLEKLLQLLRLLVSELKKFEEDQSLLNPSQMRDLLAALLAIRNGTRLEGGMAILGPDSEEAAILIKQLEVCAKIAVEKWPEGGVQRTTISGFLETKGKASAFRTNNPIQQVAEIWSGKVQTLLKQANDES